MDHRCCSLSPFPSALSPFTCSPPSFPIRTRSLNSQSLTYSCRAISEASYCRQSIAPIRLIVACSRPFFHSKTDVRTISPTSVNVIFDSDVFTKEKDMLGGAADVRVLQTKTIY
jgi:hypothetical protein